MENSIDFSRVFTTSRLEQLRKREGRTCPTLEEIMARYRSVARDKVLERANASSNRSMDNTILALPDEFKDMPFFKPTKDVYNLDVIGYVVTSTKHPEDIEPGYIWHSRRFHVHNNVGAEENKYVCLAKTFNKKCPICDYAKQGKNSGSLTKEELTALRPKERMLMCVIDRDDKDEKIQLWDVSHFHLGKLLEKELIDSDDPSIWKVFEPDSGTALRRRFSKETFNGRDFWKPERIDFKTRKNDYPDEIIDEVPSLDDILVELPYSQLEEIFVMGDSSEEEAPRERSSRRGRSTEDAEADTPAPRRSGRTARREEADADADADPAPARRPSRARAPEPEPEEEAPARRPARGGKRAEPEPEPEDDAPPARAPRRGRTAPAEEPEVDDVPPARAPRRAAKPAPVEDDPAEDDAPPARKPSRSASAEPAGKCPEGFAFGDDCEKDDLCDSCKVWGPCNAAKRKRG